MEVDVRGRWLVLLVEFLRRGSQLSILQLAQRMAIACSINFKCLGHTADL